MLDLAAHMSASESQFVLVCRMLLAALIWIASGLKRVVNRSRGDEIDGDPLAAPVRVLRSDLETRPPSVKPGRGKIKFG